MNFSAKIRQAKNVSGHCKNVTKYSEQLITDKKTKLNFEIFFTNAGSIKGEDFLLDSSGDNISD